MGFLSYYWRAVRGPWWVNVLSLLPTAVLYVLALVRSEQFWMWLALGTVALFVVQFIGLWLDYRKRERKRGSFEARVNNLFQEGITLSDDLAPAIPSDATEIPLFAEPAHIDRAVEFMGRVQGLLRDERPWLLPVYQETWTAEREKHKEHEAKREKSREELPNALKLRNFAEETQGVPQRVVERTLAALAAAKRQDGGR